MLRRFCSYARCFFCTRGVDLLRMQGFLVFAWTCHSSRCSNCLLWHISLQSDHAILAAAECIIGSLGFTNQEEIPEDYNLGKHLFLFLSNTLLTSAKVLVFPWIVWTVVLCVVLMVSILTSHSSESSSSFQYASRHRETVRLSPNGTFCVLRHNIV